MQSSFNRRASDEQSSSLRSPRNPGQNGPRVPLDVNAPTGKGFAGSRTWNKYDLREDM